MILQGAHENRIALEESRMKRGVVFLLCLTMISMLTACGSKDSADKTEEAIDEWADNVGESLEDEADSLEESLEESADSAEEKLEAEGEELEEALEELEDDLEEEID